MAISRKVERDMLREKYFNLIFQMFAEYTEEDVMQVKTNEIAFPVVGSEGNEDWIVVTVKVPTGANKGIEPYDGYSEAESYKLRCAEKKRKAKEKAEEKERKKKKDEEIRRKKEEMKNKG